MDWKNKTILIVGGAGGIGLATAAEFANCGANIAIADVKSGNFPAQYLFVQSDISKVSDCADMMAAHLQMTGI